RELDVPPAVLRRLAARLPERYPLLLDSVAAGPLSRASLLLAEPGAALWLDAEGRLEARGLTPSAGGFLAALEDWWLRERGGERFGLRRSAAHRAGRGRRRERVSRARATRQGVCARRRHLPGEPLASLDGGSRR